MEVDLNQKEEYKETELGLLPKDWKVVRLGEVVNFESGKRMKGGALKSGQVLSLGGEHIGDFGLINLSEPKFISKQFYDNLKKGKLNTGDVIICKDGAKTGKAAYISHMPTRYAAVNEHIFIIRSRNSNLLINQFIFFFIFSSIGQKQVREAYHGLIGGITNTDISNFKIPLTPLSEQKKIAFVLSTVQEAKEKTEDVIKATKELKKSMMKHLFAYGPVPIDEAEHVPLKETEIGLVPEKWEVVRLGDISKISSGGSAPQGKEYFNEGKYPFIRVQHIDNEDYAIRNYDFITDKAVADYKLKLYPKGTIVFPKSGASVYLEKRAMLPVDAYIVSHLCALNSDDENVLQDFLFYVLISMKLAKEKASGYPTLNLSEVKKVLIPLPPLSEQQKIASILSAIDQKIEAEESKKKALEDLFKSMLHNLMTAKVRVNNLTLGAEK